MILSLILISCLITLSFYSLLILNSKIYWLNAIAKSDSALYQSSNNFKNKTQKGIINYLGLVALKLIPENFTKQIREDLYFINRNPDELINSYGLIFAATIILGFYALISKNLGFLGLLVVLVSFFLLEIKISVHNTENKIENNLDHIVKCLKVLVIKAETPIITALEIISRDLNSELKDVKRELTKIIERAQKSGIKKTLLEWDTKLLRFKDFISLLSSIQEGSSKIAIKDNINNFLDKYQEEKNEKLKSEAENLQLYLIIPVVLMLIISMLPMIDAINFYMNFYIKNTGVIK